MTPSGIEPATFRFAAQHLNHCGTAYKIVKLLKPFKIIIVAPTCFGLHKPSSGSAQPVLRQSYNVDIGYVYRYLKLSAYAATVPIYVSDINIVTLAKHRLSAP